MDVVLSIVAGLGLRLFLSFTADTGPFTTFTTTLLGAWEGAVVHQVSARSKAPRLDHLLAFGLRLAIDLLISKDFHRMVLVVICSGLAASFSESVVPYATLRLALKKERERDKERRHRPTRSEQFFVPILSTPLPPRVRAYKEPERVLATSTPAPIPPQQILSPTAQFQPPTPPSFFLQDSVVYSPALKPLQISSAEKEGSSYPPDTLPVRPRSAVAAVLEAFPGSPPPIPVPLPTPPESAQSAVPSDGQHDNEAKADAQNPRFDRQLYTIPELSSPEDESQAMQPPNQEPTDNVPASEANRLSMSAGITNVPLPVPNADLRRVSSSTLARWLSSQAPDANPADTIFTHPFSSPPGAAPLPIPVRIRNHGSTPQERTPQPNGMEVEDVDADGSVVPEFDEGDLLRTPPAQNALHLAAENDHDLDALQTPQGLVQPDAEDVLSPLALDVRSEPSRDPTPIAEEPPIAITTADEDLIPGSLSQNTLLQPPLPPSGPLIRKPIPPPESPPPPSPASLHSGFSEESVISTRLPHKLYSRAGELRQKAREEEKVRAQVEEQRRTAEREGRPLEALFLKVKVRELDAETTKLHEKAARRYYAGVFVFTSLSFLGCDLTFVKPTTQSKYLTRLMSTGCDHAKHSTVLNGQSSRPVVKEKLLFAS